MSNKIINVLLTGAGFTANFGSPLARQIYNILLNTPYVQGNKEIRELFLLDKNIKNSNYENIYEQIQDSQFDEKLKKEYNELLQQTFLDKIDYFSQSPQWNNTSGVESQDLLLEKFLIKFICSKNKSIFFSLNQDLFIERQCFRLFQEYQPDNNHIKSKLNEMKMDNHSARNLKRLGVKDIITTHHVSTPLEKLIQHISAKDKKDAEKNLHDWIKSNTPYTYYIKLHGSLDYYYEDMPLFITGENKSGRITSCSLTKYYSEIFEKILIKNNCNLIIIGYGFKDDHINKILSDFILKKCNHDEIHIIDKIDLQKFMEKTTGKIDSCKLKDKLKSYHPDGLDARTLASFIESNPLNLK